MPADQVASYSAGEAVERLHGRGDRLLLVVREQRQQRLGEPGEVPLRDGGLVAVRVPPLVVDRAEHRGQVEGLQEGARPVVDRLAGDRHVVGVHDAVHEADQHPPRDQLGLRRDDRLEQGQVRPLRLRRTRVVPADRVVGEASQEVDVTQRAGVLEAADPQVAAGHPGEHGTGQHAFAPHRPPRRHDGEGPGRRDAQGVHRLADDVLAQHRADGGQPVTAARQRRATGPLEVEVAQPAVGVPQLAQQQGTAVTEAVEAAELVPGVGLRHRSGALRHRGADEQAHAVGAPQPVRVEPEADRQRFVEHQQPGVRRLLGLPGHGQLGELAREQVVQEHGRCRGDAHDSRLRRACHPALALVCSQQRHPGRMMLLTADKQVRWAGGT
jgi:hypothetical protein